jgi:choline-sulfatase
MVAGFLLPHNPYICPRELFEEYTDKVPVPERSDAEEATLHPAIKYIRQRRGEDTLTKEEHRRARAAYYGLTTYLDARIGEVLDALKQTHFAENTIVIYVSDHGDMCGEHGMWWKSTFYEGSAKVPMMWSWPGHFPANITIDSVTSLLDISPTLTDFADAPQLPLQRGNSLRAMLETA